MNVTPTVDPTSQAAWLANSKLAAQNDADRYNAQVFAFYKRIVDNENLNREAHLPGHPVPDPPFKAVIQPVSTFPEGDYYAMVITMTERVCSPLPLLPDLSQPTPTAPDNIVVLKSYFGDDGVTMNSDTWFIAGEGDTWPVGKKTYPIPLPGLVGNYVCIRMRGPGGMGGFYERLSPAAVRA